jgi:hypothetical protein
MGRIRRFLRPPTGELYVYALVASALCITYVVVSFAPSLLGRAGTRLQRTRWSFSQLPRPEITVALIPLVLVVGTLFVSRPRARLPDSRIARSGRLARIAFRFGLFALAILVFFALRNKYINPDGIALAPKFAPDVPRVRAHVPHDEMFELYVHSRAWFYANRHIGAQSLTERFSPIGLLGCLFFIHPYAWIVSNHSR